MALPEVDLGDFYVMGPRKLKGAAQAYRAAVALDPGLVRSPLYALGLVLANLGEADLASAELQQAVNLAPDNPLPLQALTGLYARRGQYEKALETLTSVLKMRPSSSLYLERGDVFLMKGDPAKGLTDYSTAAQMAPNSALPQMKLGMLHQREGRVS